MESLVLESLISQVEDRAVAEVEAKKARGMLQQSQRELFDLNERFEQVGAKLTELEAALVETRENSAAAYRATHASDTALANLCDAVDGFLKRSGRGKRVAEAALQAALAEAHKIVDVPF
jgi:predicted phage tail protein